MRGTVISGTSIYQQETPLSKVDFSSKSIYNTDVLRKWVFNIYIAKNTHEVILMYIYCKILMNMQNLLDVDFFTSSYVTIVSFG